MPIPKTYLPEELRPAPRNVAWQLGRRFMLAVEKGDLKRMRAISAEAEFAHEEQEEPYRPDRDTQLSRISPKFAKVLFDGLMVETAWDLSQVKRSEVCQIPGIDARVVIWCDQVLKKRGLDWAKEE